MGEVTPGEVAEARFLVFDFARTRVGCGWYLLVIRPQSKFNLANACEGGGAHIKMKVWSDDARTLRADVEFRDSVRYQSFISSWSGSLDKQNIRPDIRLDIRPDIQLSQLL